MQVNRQENASTGPGLGSTLSASLGPSTRRWHEESADEPRSKRVKVSPENHSTNETTDPLLSSTSTSQQQKSLDASIDNSLLGQKVEGGDRRNGAQGLEHHGDNGGQDHRQGEHGEHGDSVGSRDHSDNTPGSVSPQSGLGYGQGGSSIGYGQAMISNKPSVGSDEWLRLRRDNHKEVERRRRETINSGINELAKIVPNCEKNKGQILRRTVDYIKQLRSDETANIEKWTLEKLLTEQAIAELSSSNEKLKAELERAWREADQWKKACASAGVKGTEESRG